MNVSLAPGKYVVAVSGGVDSVVLLHLLVQQYGLPLASDQLPITENRKQSTDNSAQLIVAHFDHGIREDSGEDRQFVERLAAQLGLPFEYAEGKLGPGSSEETARAARYKFLRDVQQRHGAAAIVTAHHQDDVLETAILNLVRGTGRKGLTALGSSTQLIRPLLGCTKGDIYTYAKEHDLQWHEDRTNQSTAYLRNYIRLQLLPRFTQDDKARLLDIINHSREVNAELDEAITHLLPVGDALDRAWFIQLPHELAKETMAAWLRQHEVREFDRKSIERLVVTAKTGRPGTIANIYSSHMLRIGLNILALDSKER